MSRSWVVHKFGGSSVADADHYRRVADVLANAPGERKAVVVSAMKGMTDGLLGLIDQAEAGEDYRAGLQEIESRQLGAFNDLLGSSEDALSGNFRDIADLLRGAQLVGSADGPVRDVVSGSGELWSARLLTAYLISQGLSARMVDAREFLEVASGEMGPVVDWESSSERLGAITSDDDSDYWIIPGYVARTPRGRPTTLGRNGSDFSAAIVGQLVKAEEIHIWTDVDGVMSADPRLVSDAQLLDSISYDEALELAYFGAKVLHPQTLAPAIAAQIPVFIRNTFAPEKNGTRIGPQSSDDFQIKGITAVRDVALINVEGAGMIGVPGTARRLFGALKRGNISVVMISQASSEHSICVAVQGPSSKTAVGLLQEEFDEELRGGYLQSIASQRNLAVLAVVGDAMAGHPGVAARLFSALGNAGINIHAIAQGSSERNISTVIHAEDAERGLRTVHSAFYLSPQTLSVGVLGCGNVGQVLIDQIQGELKTLREESNVDIRVRAISRSTRMLLENHSIDLADWRDRLENHSQPADPDALVAHIQDDHIPHAVLIDCTASEEVALRHADWLARGIHVITANKKGCSAQLSYYQSLRQACADSGSRYLYETTVGAGLPVVQSLRDLRKTGDRVKCVEGIFSGTLAYLFNLFDGSRPFSELVHEAWQKGYTEPDPRDDLSGTDVARKLVILAREIGINIELEDLKVSSLVPEGLESGSIELFLEGLKDHDESMKSRYQQALSDGSRLRFVARIADGEQGVVGLTTVPADHPFAGIDLTDNVVRYVTERYCDNPLVVRGPGAGPAVTAGGIFADLLRLSSMLGAQV